MFEHLRTALERGYSPAQQSLYVLAMTHAGSFTIVRAIKGIDEVISYDDETGTLLYRYQYGKANCFRLTCSPKEAAKLRRAGEWPEILDQTVLEYVTGDLTGGT